MSGAAAETALLREIIALLQAGDLTGAAKLQRIGMLTDAYRLSGLRRRLIDECGLIVQSGPFAGMQWLAAAAEGSYIPKLLGAYECELHETVGRICRSGYHRIVNIGCAEGYYAVGFKCAVPDAAVVAFDIDERARRRCEELASLNGVEVAVESECDEARLEMLAGPGTCIVCDIEGEETDLLDPEKSPGLRRCDLLVELHPMDGGGDTGDVVLPRFASTHDIELVNPAGRDTGAYPALAGWPQQDQLLALLERTEPTRWAWMAGKS